MYSTCPATPFCPLLCPLLHSSLLFCPSLLHTFHRFFLNLFSNILSALSPQSGDRLHCRSPSEYTSNPTTTTQHWQHKQFRQATCSPTLRTSRTFLERRAFAPRPKRCDAPTAAMRLSSGSPLLSALVLLFYLIPIAIASPFAFEGNPLEKRCSNPCGWNDQICCSASQACSTNSANEAVCIDSSSGTWQYYTTTIIVTELDKSTITSVWSSHIQTAAAATATGTCRLDLGESTCGSTCCGAAQECQDGVCVAESSSAAVTGAEATPGVRGTSSGASTVTQTSAPTTTEAFIAPIGTDGAALIGVKASGGGGLSGGAIAGIVIGVIAGVMCLLLLCACLCFKGALEGLLAALGIRKRRRQETTVIEERYSHHSHGSRPPPPRRTWFGSKPAAAGTDSEVSEKKSKFSWAKIAIILGALALCLGLKRRRDQEHDDDDKTSYTYPSSYYYYSDYTRSKLSS